MPPKAVANGESACTLRGQALTSSEVKILFGALNNLNAPLDINLQGAAETAGLKPNSYKEMYRQFRRKYELGNPNAAAAGAAAAVVASGGDGSHQSVTASTNSSSSSTATPKKAPETAGDSGGGRPRARPKKMLLTPGVGGGVPNQGVETALVTPGTPMMNLNFNDMTPETPSKKAFGTSNKRSATEPNPDETPAKKGPAARKPRVSAAAAKQKAVAAAAQAETKVKTEAATDAGFSFIGDSYGNGVNAAMEGISQAAETIEDTLAAAAADEGYITATEGGGPDYGEI